MYIERKTQFIYLYILRSNLIHIYINIYGHGKEANFSKLPAPIPWVFWAPIPASRASTTMSQSASAS